MDRRQKIISELYLSKDMEDALCKMNPENLREELKQELFKVICEMNSEKLFELYNRNELRYYAVRVMLNLIQSKTSTFYYQFRKHLEILITLPISIMERQDDEDGRFNVDVRDATRTIFDKSLNEEEQDFTDMLSGLKIKVSELSWYEQDLFNLYIEKDKNASVIARETGIPIRSIYHTLAQIKTKLKSA